MVLATLWTLSNSRVCWPTSSRHVATHRAQHSVFPQRSRKHNHCGGRSPSEPSPPRARAGWLHPFAFFAKEPALSLSKGWETRSRFLRHRIQQPPSGPCGRPRPQGRAQAAPHLRAPVPVPPATTAAGEMLQVLAFFTSSAFSAEVECEILGELFVPVHYPDVSGCDSYSPAKDVKGRATQFTFPEMLLQRNQPAANPRRIMFERLARLARTQNGLHTVLRHLQRCACGNGHRPATANFFAVKTGPFHRPDQSHRQ